MGIFDKKQKDFGFMDEIRCDEPSYLIWKWHPAGSQLNDNDRENAIRWGSSLRVKDGEVAVFVYKQEDGAVQEFIEGPFDQTINTSNFPVLSSLVGLLYDGGTPFQAEVYFINLARIVQIKFGVPFFDVYDPRFADFAVPIAVRGTISFRIEDYKKFIKLHRLTTFDFADFQKQIRDVINRYVKNKVVNIPAEHNIPVIQIETKIAQINEVIEQDISERLEENFGVVISGIDIGSIEIDKSSDGYIQLMSVTKEVTAATVQAQAAVNIKDLHDKQRIEAENYQEILRVQREEGQYAQHKQTQTANFAAYQTEAQTQVGVAGANALGQMGMNNGGNVDLGGGDAGFNPAAMIAGMALGGAVGQNIAGTMNNLMSGVQQQSSAITPPPINIAYHTVMNGVSVGPFDITVLNQMVQAGTFSKESLVWKPGMAEWTVAGAVPELQAIFATANKPDTNNMPPVPPVL